MINPERTADARLAPKANRQALLVGSLPFADEEECTSRALDVLGPALFSLPDGEVGDKTPAFPKGNRIAWVVHAIEKLTQDTDNWQVIKPPVRSHNDGMAVSYDTFQKLKPRHAPADMPHHVTLGYDVFFRRSYPIFQRLRRQLR